MTTVDNMKGVNAFDKIIVVLCFCLLGVFPTTLSNGPNLIIKLTDQSGRPIAGADLVLWSYGGPEPTVAYSEARTHWNGYSIFEPGVTFNGFWGEIMATVTNNGGAGYVVVWGEYMTGNTTYTTYSGYITNTYTNFRLYGNNTTIYMDAGETLNATVFIPISNDSADYDLNWTYYCGFIPKFRGTYINTGSDGLANFSLPAGVYTVTAIWFSRYNRGPAMIIDTTLTINSTNTPVTLLASIYDVTLQLVTPSGKPISGANMSLAGVLLGMTDADGKVVALQVPSNDSHRTAAYPVTAIWYGIDVSPAPITITASKTYVLRASNVANLSVQVVGARGQGLYAAKVDIKNSAGITVFRLVTNEQGVASVEVPYDTYTISVNYKGLMNTTTLTVSTATPSPVTVATNVFIELGQAMTFATFLLYIIVIIIVIAVCAVVICELRRRQRLKQPVKQDVNR
jgi:hypothetical protein